MHPAFLSRSKDGGEKMGEEKRKEKKLTKCGTG
jgi:hypothetical protein